MLSRVEFNAMSCRKRDNTKGGGHLEEMGVNATIRPLEQLEQLQQKRALLIRQKCHFLWIMSARIALGGGR